MNEQLWINEVTFEDLTTDFESFYQQEFGSIETREVYEKVIESKKIGNYLRFLVHNKTMTTGKEVLTVIHSSRLFTLAKAEKIFLASVIILKVWRKGTKFEILKQNDEYFNTLFFQLLYQCDNYKLHSSKLNFFARFYKHLGDQEEFIEFQIASVSKVIQSEIYIESTKAVENEEDENTEIEEGNDSPENYKRYIEKTLLDIEAELEDVSIDISLYGWVIILIYLDKKVSLPLVHDFDESIIDEESLLDCYFSYEYDLDSCVYNICFGGKYYESIEYKDNVELDDLPF